MKPHRLACPAWATAALLTSIQGVLAQGPLTPPGAPAPTMRSTLLALLLTPLLLHAGTTIDPAAAHAYAANLGLSSDN